MNKEVQNWFQVKARATDVANTILEQVGTEKRIRLYGVPRGGLHVMLLVGGYLEHYHNKLVVYVEDPINADFILDDLIDSGATAQRHEQYKAPFFTLYDKRTEFQNSWIVFPWEVVNDEPGPEQNVVRLLQYIGEDPEREGLRETPKRVIRSYGELFTGYKQNPKDLMTVFEDGACQQMVLLRGVEVSSFCEHHMLPFRGVAHVGYIPYKRVIGISKLARLVDMFAKRLQIQERICQQVTGALDEHLQPLGSACVMEAQHLCMACRGVMKQNSVMVTSSLTGEFLTKQEVRQEFMHLIRS